VNLVKKVKTAHEDEEDIEGAAVDDVTRHLILLKKLTLKSLQIQPTPQKLTLNSEETSDAAAVDADVGTSHENLLQMAKLVNHDKLVSLEMPLKSLVTMVKIANVAEGAVVMMILLKNHVTTMKRKRPNRVKMLFLHFADYFEVGTMRPESLSPTDRLVNLVT